MPRLPVLVSLLAVVVMAASWSQYALHAQPPAESAAEGPQKRDPQTGLALPPFWPEGHPVPKVQSNCVKCHLTAGRELSAAVLNFAHSVHDLNELSCADCHGGNTEDDARAHEEEFGFIGTKLSAHWAKCQECHAEQAALIADSPHAWDFSKRINIDYPMCIDCHGNHDIGDPNGGYQMKDACLNCHEAIDDEMPRYATVIEGFDQLWTTMSKVRQARLKSDEPVPPELAEEIAGVRASTMAIVHGLPALDEAAVKQYAEQVQALETRLKAAAVDRP